MFPKRQNKPNATASGNRGRSSNVHEQVRRMLNGQVITPSDYPPTFAAQPWNNMTLIIRKTVTGTYDISQSELLYFLKGQAGFNGCKEILHFDYRVRAIRAWAMSDGSSLTMYAMDFSHDTSANAIELCRVDSNAMRNMYARTGYKWPAHLQNTTLSTGSSKSKIAVFATDATKLEIHLDMHWRGAESATIALQYRVVSDKSFRNRSLSDYHLDSEDQEHDIPKSEEDKEKRTN